MIIEGTISHPRSPASGGAKNVPTNSLRSNSSLFTPHSALYSLFPYIKKETL